MLGVEPISCNKVTSSIIIIQGGFLKIPPERSVNIFIDRSGLHYCLKSRESE
jgi:hypothetical protein